MEVFKAKSPVTIELCVSSSHPWRLSRISVYVELIPQVTLCAVSLRLNLEVGKGVKLIESPAQSGELQRFPNDIVAEAKSLQPENYWIPIPKRFLTQTQTYIYRTILLPTVGGRGWESGWQIAEPRDKLWIAHMFRYLAKGKQNDELTNLATTLQTLLYQSITFVCIYQTLQTDSCTLAIHWKSKIPAIKLQFPQQMFGL